MLLCCCCQNKLALPLQHVPLQQDVLECLQCSRQGCTPAFAVAVYRNALQNIQVADRLGEQTGMPYKSIHAPDRLSERIRG